ncbi:MAG: prepilin-type N-terminal cleavage/methylation domain-containing protein [Gammaproteobacteria bacterium]|nr:prepilin-type N-terminal cleavage/methylation domain-containing protein [Gammaproteobacteria bacterium]
MRARREQGYTLTELVVTLSIMAIIAAIAIPDFTSDETAKLDIATANVVGAIRFAHSESIRTGLRYGVVADQGNQSIRVYRVDTSVEPATLLYDNYDPLTKKPYELIFSSDESDVVMAEAGFEYGGGALSADYLEFSGGTGIPAASSAGILRLLDSAVLRFSYRNASKTVSVSPMTARVTVQ